MPVNTMSLLEAVSIVAQKHETTVTLKKSAAAGAIAGGSCFVGAVLAGPVGLVLGGLVGTSIAYMKSGDIKPLYKIINEDFSHEQRAQLLRLLEQAFVNVGPQDVALLGVFLLQNANLHEKALKIAIDYVSSQVTA